MWRWIKRALTTWSQKVLQREHDRLTQENRALRAELEKVTGQPVQFTDEQQARLAKAARGKSR
jgi:hypothetical protein